MFCGSWGGDLWVLGESVGPKGGPGGGCRSRGGVCRVWGGYRVPQVLMETPEWGSRGGTSRSWGGGSGSLWGIYRSLVGSVGLKGGL